MLCGALLFLFVPKTFNSVSAAFGLLPMRNVACPLIGLGTRFAQEQGLHRCDELAHGCSNLFSGLLCTVYPHRIHLLSSDVADLRNVDRTTLSMSTLCCKPVNDGNTWSLEAGISPCRRWKPYCRFPSLFNSQLYFAPVIIFSWEVLYVSNSSSGGQTIYDARNRQSLRGYCQPTQTRLCL